jgi:hypothetical protein
VRNPEHGEVPPSPDQSSELANLIRAARGEFAHAVYELSLAASQAENFDRLERALYHLDTIAIRRDQFEIQKEKLALDRDRLLLDRENFEYNGARVAMENMVELQAVDKREDLDQDDKIKLARTILFGQDVGGMSSCESLPSCDTLVHANTQSALSETDEPCPATAGSPQSLTNGVKSSAIPSSMPVHSEKKANSDFLEYQLLHPEAFENGAIPVAKKTGPKTGQELVDEAKNPAALLRYFATTLANGSSDRLEEILKPPSDPNSPNPCKDEPNGMRRSRQSLIPKLPSRLRSALIRL